MTNLIKAIEAFKRGDHFESYSWGAKREPVIEAPQLHFQHHGIVEGWLDGELIVFTERYLIFEFNEAMRYLQIPLRVLPGNPHEMQTPWGIRRIQLEYWYRLSYLLTPQNT